MKPTVFVSSFCHLLVLENLDLSFFDSVLSCSPTVAIHKIVLQCPGVTFNKSWSQIVWCDYVLYKTIDVFGSPGNMLTQCVLWWTSVISHKVVDTSEYYITHGVICRGMISHRVWYIGVWYHTYGDVSLVVRISHIQWSVPVCYNDTSSFPAVCLRLKRG